MICAQPLADDEDNAAHGCGSGHLPAADPWIPVAGRFCARDEST